MLTAAEGGLRPAVGCRVPEAPQGCPCSPRILHLRSVWLTGAGRGLLWAASPCVSSSREGLLSNPSSVQPFHRGRAAVLPHHVAPKPAPLPLLAG